MGFFDFLKKMPNPMDPLGLMGGGGPMSMMGGGGEAGGGGDALGSLLGSAASGAASGAAASDAAEQGKEFDPARYGGVPQTKFNQTRQKQLGMGGNT